MGFPHILNQQGAGTRQTVYYNNEPKSTSTETTDDHQANPTFLVYNRVNTVVGDVSQRQAPPSPNHSIRSQKSQTASPKLSPSEEVKRKARKENPIWYEYGCV